MVDKNASPGEIEDAFNERKEKNRTAKQSDKAFFANLEKLSEAHSVLSDKTKREEYDRELANKKGKSKEGETSKTAYHKDEKSQGRTQTFGGGSHHIRGGTIHNVGSTFRGNGNSGFVSGGIFNQRSPSGGSQNEEEAQGRTQSFGGVSHHIGEGTIQNIGSTFRGNGNGGFISGDQINMGSPFGRSPNAGSQNEEEAQGRTQTYGGGSHHFRGATIHNTGTFNGNGLVEGSDTSDSESSYDSESEFEFGKGFPFGESGSSFRTKFSVGKNNQYVDWNRACSSVKLSIFKEGILVESPQHYPEYTMIKVKALKVHVNGKVGNIPTPREKYEFKQSIPNGPVGGALSINGRIGNLEMHIDNVNANNYVEINGEITEARMIGEGNTFGKEESTKDTNKVEIRNNHYGGPSNGETVIEIDGNNISRWTT
uniref:Uncharacterized protein n=1 Tax=Meloidogyne javanica TaxID=6303 RepID=A0A915MES6_MELJA